MDIYASKNWIVIWCDNVRRGYDRVDGSIGRSYDEIKDVTTSVSRNFHNTEWDYNWLKVEKFNCLSIAEVVNMDVEVASIDEWMVAAWERNDEN